MTPDEVKHHFKKFFGYELPQTQINVFSPEFIDFCLYISNHNQMGFEEWYEKISKWSEGTALDMSFSMKRHLASHLEKWQNSRPTERGNMCNCLFCGQEMEAEEDKENPHVCHPDENISLQSVRVAMNNIFEKEDDGWEAWAQLVEWLNKQST